MHAWASRLLPAGSITGILLSAPLASWCLARAPGQGPAPPDAAPANAISQPAEVLFLHAQKLIVRPGRVIDDGAMIVEGGKIRAVGQGIVRPEGSRSIEGAVICAAFLDPWSGTSIDAGSAMDDETSAATRAVDALDVHGDRYLCEDALRAGVTVVRVQSGSAANIGGKGAVVRLAPDLEDPERVVLGDAGLASAIGIETGNRDYDVFDRLGMLDKLADQLESGRKYGEDLLEYRYELEEWQKQISEKEKELEKEFKKAKKDREKEMAEAEEKGKEFKEKSYKEDKKPKAPKHDPDRQVLAEVADGRLPLFVVADGAAEIRGLLEVTKPHERVRLVLVGGAEALPFADELAERQVPVVIWPAPRSARSEGDRIGADLSLATRLSAEGVEVLLGSGGVRGATRDLPLFAALAVGHGLDREAAFEALTLGAARALDCSDRLGSLEVGKDADLLVLDGEPLGGATRVRWVVSAGRVVVQPEN